MTDAPTGAAGAGERSGVAALLRYWLPPAAYVGLIFSLSSIRGDRLPGGFFPNMDKAEHLLEYSLLGLLLGRAIRFTLAGRSRAAAAVATVALGALVGAADEIYQRRVPGRSSDIRDWVVDVIAVTASVVFTQWVTTRSLRKRNAAGTGNETR